MMPSMFETLEQEVMWYGQDGFPYVVDEMETSHIRNLIGFLQRRAPNLYARKDFYEFRIYKNAPEEVFNEWMHMNGRAIPEDPAEWLARRPLMQKLERILRQRESIEQDSLQIAEAE